MTIEERVVGCVLGLAIGDALGAAFEGLRAIDIPHPLPAFERRRAGFPPGSTTDDTALARNLVRSLTDRGGFDPDDLLRRHLDWFRSGAPGVGSLTRRVLRRVADGMRPEEAARTVWEERGPEVSAGNGSVMYCAPLGAAYANRPEALYELAPRLSGLTHHDERCRTAVLAVTLAAAALVRGDPAEPAVREALRAVLDRDGGEELEFLVQAVGDARRIDGPDMGFCLYAAAAGLQAAGRGGRPEDELMRIVGLGGDTDTNGAVAGALVGSRVGRGGLPPSWLERLRDAGAIEREARALVVIVERS